MNFNFEMILFYATVISGLIALFDILFLARRRQLAQKDAAEIKLPIIVDYARSFFPVLLIVFLLRSFLFEPFRIPSGSLEPTLLTGDFILVNKYDYGIRLPVVHTKIYTSGAPKRGDIMVFRWPPNPSYDFIKRVIGLPGDKISYINKELYVNGQKIPQEYLKESLAVNETGSEWQAQEKQEDLLGVKHRIYIDTAKSSQDFHDIIVPKGMYFVMGDNRDDSADSRYWGFVPDKNIVGKAVLVWLSWDGAKKNLRFNRMGKLIH
ncbi:Signal peptidase I [Aquicella siphonis]|uniref:Signal peptidase I n=1 Tax=Aquicella siphonis TaxID=254247 RepID=A0A5E4PHG8_9COXI|nr:signal peptidase I [Aquicella siphonis]VVC75813.1 Signal peptidase I [Aquicella siphonis]